jgi:hypothetical protein
MGNASVIYSDIWSSFHNQAGLASFNKLAFGLYNESWFTDPPVGIKALLFSIPINKSTFGISLRHYSFISINEQKFGVAYSRKLSDKVAAGIQLNYHRMHVSSYYGNGYAISAEGGIIIEPIKNFFIGAHIFNPTFSKIKRFSEEYIPVIFRIGAGYYFSDKVNGCFEIEKYINYKPSYKTGFEYNFYRSFFLRFGGSTNPNRINGGFGFGIYDVKADIAFVYYQVFGLIPNISLSYNIK